jgi:hypothetical protein
MPATYTPSSDLLSYAGRAAHDVAVGAELGLVVVNAALAQASFRRAPAKRLLRRGS